jgi:hypothetical protein
LVGIPRDDCDLSVGLRSRFRGLQELELVAVGIEQRDTNQARAHLRGSFERDSELGRLTLYGLEIIHQD